MMIRLHRNRQLVFLVATLILVANLNCATTLRFLSEVTNNEAPTVYGGTEINILLIVGNEISAELTFSFTLTEKKTRFNGMSNIFVFNTCCGIKSHGLHCVQVSTKNCSAISTNIIISRC